MGSSLPVKTKTWEFVLNEAVGDSSENNTNANQLYHLAKNLTDGGIFTTPCVCRGSSDGTVAGMDDVNRWTQRSDVIINGIPGTSHAWIVLEFPGILFDGAANPLQVLFTRNSASVGYCSIIISMADGFGAANGGTDGDASNDPTATDQWAPFYQNTLYGGSGNLLNLVQNIFMSTDGACCRILLSGVSVARRTWISFETPKNPIDDWARPFGFMCLGDSNGFNNLGNWNGAPLVQATNYHAFLFNPNDDGIGVIDQGSYRNQGWASMPGLLGGGTTQAAAVYSGLMPTEVAYPIMDLYVVCWSKGVGYNGYLGQLHDVYFVGSGCALNASLPKTGALNQWYSLGTVIIPGDGANAIAL